MNKVEWAGSITGLIGAAVLSTNTSLSGWGFVLFLISNLFLIFYAFQNRANGLLTMQLGFTATSVLGITRWLS
ncbi:MAG: hypothetical protein GY751_06595 [Bacteroidetes bacterium]|nr:hypothetical protein [Bacteroidota bacterium]